MSSRLITACSFVLLSVGVNAQLVVDDTMTPAQLVQDVLLGGGVSVSNITFNGVAVPPTAQPGSASFTQVGDLGLAAGVILSSGLAASAIGPEVEFSTDDLGNNGNDPDLEAIVGDNISNYAILEFDFIPTGDSLRFRYVFASEEYPNFVCSFNDAFGFFLSGPGISGPYTDGAINIAVLPDGVTPVSIANVNSGQNNDPNDPLCPAVNPQYYVNNTDGPTVSFGGFTVVLTAFALVQCGETYHIKLAIADAGNEFDTDTSYDSAVFLEAGSFTSTGQVVPSLAQGPGVSGTTFNEGCQQVLLRFTRQGDISVAESVDMLVGGTSTPGVDYAPALPAQLDFQPGDSVLIYAIDVPLDADGDETLEITMSQLIACANSNVQTEFVFTITSPPPLTVVTGDIQAACGDVSTLVPQVSGGLGFYVFDWSTGDASASIQVSPAQTATYTVTVTDSCNVAPATGSFTVSLPVNDPLVIGVSPPTEVPCLETGPIGVVSVTGGNGAYTYVWEQDGQQLGTNATLTVPSGDPTWYVVTVTEGCGSSVQDSVLVSMAPLDPIVITTSGDVTVICRGDVTTLAITDIQGGNGVYSIAWEDPSGATISTDQDVDVGVPSDAVYTITVDDQCGTQGVQEIRTRIPVYSQFQVGTNADQTICFGDSALAEVYVTGGSGYYRIDWLDQGWTDPILKVFPLEGTTYTVNVTDQCGEVLSDQVTVDVEKVFVEITSENLGQDDWHLRAATVPPALTHVWDMGDVAGTRYREEHVFHSYVDLEDHWVTLYITTGTGCEGVDSVLLKPPAHLYFPNAFTPDGDGTNDTFGPKGNDLTRFEMTIFDRWGTEVFSTMDPLAPWNGDVNGGGAATTGVYVYKYRAEGLYFPSTEGYGHVTLLKGTQQ